jgi:IcmF-related N-terminal domain
MASDTSQVKKLLVIAGLVGAGAIVSAPLAMAGLNYITAGIVVGGIVAVALIVTGCMAIWKMLIAKAGKGFLGRMQVFLRNKPNISDPAELAKIDQLSRKFEEGLDKFRAAGKNLYTVPWYLLVGQPGSGKTEAIRKCGVGFPPGLQDEQAGTGGTVSMDWWFTNNAVIVDTAGRFVIDQNSAKDGALSAEWQEFLRLLSTSRPNCPINGLLLVIPADSLLADQGNEIHDKANRLSQRMGLIQRSLGVRFPVYILVTKCDKIPGFRDFFRELSDPMLQSQIMGWSNPAPLDSPFNPEVVSEHLGQVRNRLLRRRMKLIEDPVNSDDANGRRLDQVDSLYSFPDELMKLTPRLRGYLELIFATGDWTGKPLFLRGIYFTSAIESGVEVDQAVAQALNIPLSVLQQKGGEVARNRTLFLKDLFIKKIFAEDGLVTRAGNTRKLQWRRKAVLIGAGIAACIALMVCSWFSLLKFQQTIGSVEAGWPEIADDARNDPADMPVFQLDPTRPDNQYRYYPASDGALDAASRVAMMVQSMPVDMQKELTVPTIFKPAADGLGLILNKNSGGLQQMRTKAYEQLVEGEVIGPAVDAARESFIHQHKQAVWSSDTAPARMAALAELVRLEVAHDKLNSSADTQDASLVDLSALVHPALASDDQAKFDGEAKSLQEAVGWMYAPEHHAGAWPPASLWPTPEDGKSTTEADEALARGTEQFEQYWKAQLDPNGDNFAAIVSLNKSLTTFVTDEKNNLLPTTQPSVDTTAAYAKQIGLWSDQVRKLSDDQADADGLIAKVQLDQSGSLDAAYRAAVAKVGDAAKKSVADLLGLFPASSDASAPLPPELGQMKAELTRFSGSLQGLIDAAAGSQPAPEVDSLARTVTDPVDATQSPAFDLAVKLLNQAGAEVADAGSAQSSIVGLDDINAHEKKLTDGLAQHGDPQLAPAVSVAVTVVDWAAAQRRYRVLSAELKNLPGNAADVEQLVAAAAAQAPPHSHPTIAFTDWDATGKGTYNPSFDPTSADAVLQKWNPFIDALAKPVLNQKDLSQSYSALSGVVTGYMDDYVDYWDVEVPSHALVVKAPSYQKVIEGFNNQNNTVLRIREELVQLGKDRQAALRLPFDPNLNLATKLDAPRPDKLKTDVAALDGAITDAQDPNNLPIWEQPLENWTSVADDVLTARETILQLTPNKLNTQYLYPPPAPDQQFYARQYFSDLTRLALAELAEGYNTVAVNNLRKLKQSVGFPFPLPPGDTRTFNPDLDLAALPTVIDSVNAIGQVAQQQIDATTLAGGQPTGDDQTQKNIDMLCGKGFAGKDDLAWISRVQQIAKVLTRSQPNLPVQCTITVLRSADLDPSLPRPDPNGPTNFGGGVALWIDGIRQNVVNLEQPGAVLTAQQSIPLTGQSTDQLAIKGYAYPEDKDRQKNEIQMNSFSGQWSCLHWLLDPTTGALPSPDAKAWYVPVRLPKDPKTIEFWLKFEFDNASGTLPTN